MEASVRSWPVRGYSALSRACSSKLVQALTLLTARVLVLLRALVPGSLVQRAVLAWVRMEAACCRSNTPHYQFVARYLDRFERAGTFDRMRRFMRTSARATAARRLDAWVRIGALGVTRHELLGMRLGTPGVPPRLLMEAQLALSPGCDLTCEGCYTAEDRGGAAPRKERIAYLVDELVSAGAFAVHVIGKGEPFLSPKWANELLDVIEARPHVFFTIATHGMRIDDALAARLGRLGNTCLLVAIDGPEELHDARRGAGSYRKVHEALARLRAHGALFGYSCMVSKKSYRALTSPEFVRAREESGCAVGVHSRYFPLANDAVDELAMSAEELAEYTRAFEGLRGEAGIALMDLDEVEQHTGCHSRAGESIYVDGITGQVSPCLRVPFAPDDCRLDGDRPGRLAEVLGHAYFVSYRQRASSCPTWCGANLAGELQAVDALLEEHAQPARLNAYEQRARRRLPVLSSQQASP